MANVYFIGHQVSTETIKPEAKAVLEVPRAVIPATTETYACQLLPGYRVRVAFGNAKRVAAPQLAPIVFQQARRVVEEAQLETEIQSETLGSEVAKINATSASRALPFLEYANPDVGAKIRNGSDLTKRDVDELVEAAYKSLKREKGATSKIKDAMRSYIRTGETDNQTLLWLAQNASPTFKKLSQYAGLKARQQLFASNQQISDLSFWQETVLQTIGAIKEGSNHYSDVRIGDLVISPYQLIKEIVGAEPGPQFSWTIDDVVQGENRSGVLTLPRYKTADGVTGSNGLYPHYSVQRFVQIVAAFDSAICKILLGFVNSQKAWKNTEFEGLLIPISLLERAVMPYNKAVQTLHPDRRIDTVTRSAARELIAAKTAECFREGTLASIAAEHFGLTEDELNREGFERIVALQNAVMPIVPLTVYNAVAVRRMLNWTQQKIERISQGKLPKYRKHSYYELTRRNNSLITELRKIDAKLKEDFGVDSEAMDYFDEPPKKEALEEAIRMFGENELGFIRQIVRSGGEKA